MRAWLGCRDRRLLLRLERMFLQSSVISLARARPEKLTILPCRSRIVDVVPLSEVQYLRAVSSNSTEGECDPAYLGPGRLVPECIVNGSIDEYSQYAAHDRQ